MARPKQNKKDFVKISKHLLRARPAGVLSTGLASDNASETGWPYGSLATFAADMNGNPIFLFSELSDHCQNLDHDARASLVVEKALNKRHPQTGARVTVMGRVLKTDDPRHRVRYLKSHPNASVYADFGDFHFYKMEIEKARFVGGFAKAVWLKKQEIISPEKVCKDFASIETDIIDHMNNDHGEAVANMVHHLIGRKSHGWRLSGIDPDGINFQNTSGFARLNFDRTLTNVNECRSELVKLAGLAKKL